MTSPYPPRDVLALYAVYASAFACICFGLFAKSDMLKDFKYRGGTDASPVAVRIIAIVAGIGGILMMLFMNHSSK